MMTFVPSDGVSRSTGVSLAPAISAGETWSDLENKRGWGARDAWTAPQVQHARPQAPEPHKRINESFDPLADVYSFQDERIMEACGGVLSGLVSLVFVSLPRGGLVVAIFPTVCALWLLWRSLLWPYELRIAPSGLLRFTSVTGRTDLCAADIVRLVRRERVSNGKLAVIRVVHCAGSITLDGNEEVFARLAKLVPAAQVNSEKWDDTD